MGRSPCREEAASEGEKSTADTHHSMDKDTAVWDVLTGHGYGCRRLGHRAQRMRLIRPSVRSWGWAITKSYKTEFSKLGIYLSMEAKTGYGKQKKGEIGLFVEMEFGEGNKLLRCQTCWIWGPLVIHTLRYLASSQKHNAMWRYTVCAGADGEQPKSPRAERLKGRHEEEKKTGTETEKASIRPGHPLGILVSKGKRQKNISKSKRESTPNAIVRPRKVVTGLQNHQANTPSGEPCIYSSLCLECSSQTAIWLASSQLLQTFT